MEYGSAIDTEVMDFGGDKFSSSEFGQRPPMLFSMQRSFEPEVFNSSESQVSGSQEMSLGSSFMPSTDNQYQRQPFHRSHSQPLWGRRALDFSSSESSQSETYQSDLIVAKAKIIELSRANMALNARVDKLEGMFKAVISGGQTSLSSMELLSRSSLLTAPSRAASPFLGARSTAPSPLITSFSLPAHSANTLPQREDHPNVNYWYRRDWLNRLKDSGNSTDIGVRPVRGKSLISKGINKNAKYIEDANGNPVDGYRLKDILNHQRAIWTTFRNISRAPLTWGKADAEVAHIYRHEMRTKFPEFALCESDWKADHLATEHYPSWYNNHVKGVEIEGDTNASTTLPTGSKRPAATEISEAKKAKKVRNPLLEKPTTNVTEDLGPSSPIIPPVSSISSTVTERVLPTSSDATQPANNMDMDGINSINVLPYEPTIVQSMTVTKVQNPSLEEHDDMTNDSLPLNPELLDSTTAVTAVTTIQAVHGAAEGVPSSGSTDPVGTVGTVTAGDTGETERNKEIGKHKVVAVATAVVDSPLTSLSAAPLHSANENGLLVQENQEGASGDRNLLPVVPDFMLPEGAPSVLLNNSPLSSVIPAPDPGLTRKDLFVDSNTAELVPPATSDENGPKATQTKKGMKMRPNGSLSARNLCAKDWCAAHPNGTQAEFKQYYDHEITHEHKEIYVQRSKEAKAKK